MYTLQKIGDIDKSAIDGTFAIIGTVVGLENDENYDKLEIEDVSGKIIISKDKSVQMQIGSRILVFGTLKITPKGLIIFSESIVDVSECSPKLLGKFMEKIQNYNI
ncbi:nucleic acid-binding protein [Methanococcus sp. CF]